MIDIKYIILGFIIFLVLTLLYTNEYFSSTNDVTYIPGDLNLVVTSTSDVNAQLKAASEQQVSALR